MSRAVLLGLMLLLADGAGFSGAGFSGMTSATASAGTASAGAGSVRPTAIRPAAGVAYRAPIRGRLVVVRAFLPPPGPYSAGHRGVDVATQVGEPVLAAGGGTVRFAALVAGRGVVVVAHADGVRTEYEPVLTSVGVGAPVAAGQQIGRVQGRHGDCAAGRCLHWGASRAGVYLDPLDLLHPLAPVRLLPWTGS